MGLVENLPECASTVQTTSPPHCPDTGAEALGWLGGGGSPENCRVLPQAALLTCVF